MAKSAKAHPGNPKAERAMIGGLLMSPHVYWTIGQRLRVDHFTIDAHQKIFAAIADILNAGQKLSFSLLLSRLPDEFEDGKSAGAVVSTLMKGAEDLSQESSDLGAFAEEIVECWTRGRAITACEVAVKEIKTQAKPISDVLLELETKIADASSASSETQVQTLGDLIDKSLNRSRESAASGDEMSSGFDTGLHDLDQILKPLRRGRIYFLGGDEKSGKTTLAQQILTRAARRTFVMMAQGEMDETEIGDRSIAAEADVPTDVIERGDLDSFQSDRVSAALYSLPRERFLFWAMPDGVKLSQLRHKCLAVKKEHGDLGMVVVDHLLLVESDKEYDNEFTAIAKVVKGLKALARELNCIIMVMTHRTRTSQNRSEPTPFASDFHGGPVIERTCDALFCIYSKHRWLTLRKPENRGQDAIDKWLLELDQTKGKAQIALLSHRHAGFPRIIEVKFRGEISRFENIN